MQLIPSFAVPRFAVMPIGDNFTMGYRDAARAAQYINCRTVIGVHYDTFGFIRINTTEAQDYFARHGLDLLLPAIGATIDV
jgi:L-ascorbate metabolism protein UlaG (beta-lactamase superfamily)